MGTKTILSWEEFLAAAKEGHKSEWVDSEVILMTPVGLWHEAILARLVRRLEEYCQSDTEWICFTSNAVFTMASGNWRCPDASLVRKNRFPGGVISATKADFPPDVAFEILSPSETPSHVQRKRQDYLESGVVQVWIDPEQRLIELIEPDRPLQYFHGPTPLAITSLPGLQVVPEDLFKI